MAYYDLMIVSEYNKHNVIEIVYDTYIIFVVVAVNSYENLHNILMNNQ